MLAVEGDCSGEVLMSKAGDEGTLEKFFEFAPWHFETLSTQQLLKPNTFFLSFIVCYSDNPPDLPPAIAKPKDIAVPVEILQFAETSASDHQDRDASQHFYIVLGSYPLFLALGTLDLLPQLLIISDKQPQDLSHSRHFIRNIRWPHVPFEFARQLVTVEPNRFVVYQSLEIDVSPIYKFQDLTDNCPPFIAQNVIRRRKYQHFLVKGSTVTTNLGQHQLLRPDLCIDQHLNRIHLSILFCRC